MASLITIWWRDIPMQVIARDSRRVVVASSNHAADWWEPLIHEGKVDMITPIDRNRPLRSARAALFGR